LFHGGQGTQILCQFSLKPESSLNIYEIHTKNSFLISKN